MDDFKEVAGRPWSVSECKACKIVFTDPQPTAADVSRFYGGTYHAEIRQPGATERVFGRKFDEYCDWLSTYVKPGKSLDVGCATGLLVKKLHDRGFDAQGYESNALSAEWGQREYGVPIRTGIFQPSSEPAEAYDLITLCDVLEHTLNPLQYLTEVRRIVRPSGHVMITFPHIWCAESLYYFYLSKFLRRKWIWHTCNVPGHTWEFTPSTARAVFEGAGFRLVAFRRRHDSTIDAVQWNKLVDLIHLPPFLFNLLMGRHRFGPQMHFLLQPR